MPFKTKTEGLIQVKNFMVSNYKDLKSDISSNDGTIKFNDSDLKNCKMDYDLKKKQVILKVKVTKVVDIYVSDDMKVSEIR